jgi:alcohol dehydrogenase (cytochrome c)
VPQEIDIVPEGADLLPGSGDIKNHGRIFTPYLTDQIMVKPSTTGGANWPPSSYDPTTHTLYVCATDRISTFKAADPGQPAPNKIYMGGGFGQAEANDRGIFAALDVTTNKLVWRQSWREICYSGSIVTAGGLLFVGRSDGRLTALSSQNGAKLWEFMTDAGVNTTATTFEYKGKQYVVVHAGGGVFANGKRGDGIWMFSLDGKIPSLSLGGAPGRAGFGAGGPPTAVALPVTTRPANAEHGGDIYRAACVPCHGAAGGGGSGGGPSLLKGQSHDALLGTASAGKNNMPAFKSIYSADELNDVTAYVQSMLQQGKQ